MLDSFLKFLARSLQRKAAPEKIRSYLQARGYPSLPGHVPSLPGHVRVAAVQEQLRVLKTWQAYVERMYAFTARAAGAGAQLVCFPEENGLLLLGQLPLVGPLLRLATRSMGNPPPPVPAEELEPVRLSSSAWDLPDGSLVARLLAPFSPFFQETFTTVFGELARGFGVTIMAGSCMQVADGKLVNRAYLFGPDGTLLGVQDKVHPVDMEMAMGMTPAERLQAVPTAVGRLGFPVCMDATYFETFKILRALGAQIVVIPIANLEPFQHYWALRGIWPRVQENGVYGIKSALVGRLGGLEFTGKAGVFAPLELTPDRSGVLAEAQTFDRDELVVADLDLDRLEAYRSDYFDDSNPALYRKYFPDIYR